MTTGLLASLITSLAGPSTPAAPARPRAKPHGIPPPDNIRKAQAVRMAAVAARCAEFDAALLAACAYGPRSATSLAHQLNTNPSRIKRAARRLERLGHVRVVALPYPGQAKVFCVEACSA